MGQPAVFTPTRVVVGQRVHCILYGGSDGIVFAIQGEQSPDSCRDIGGVMSMGGRAYFDVVFENGTISRSVPEVIVRGVQWTIYDEVATADEIKAALAEAAAEQQRREAKQRADNERRAKEREHHATMNPHLLTRQDRPDWSPGRFSAANIRIDLKKAFPAVKFRVRSDYNSVDVYWTDGPTSNEVDAIIDRYKCGSFNGMEDIYESDPDATFSDVFGGAKYVFGHRSETLDGVRTAWVKKHGGKPTDVPDDWLEGGRWKMKDQNMAQHIFMAWSETSL